MQPDLQHLSFRQLLSKAIGVEAFIKKKTGRFVKHKQPFDHKLFEEFIPHTSDEIPEGTYMVRFKMPNGKFDSRYYR